MLSDDELELVFSRAAILKTWVTDVEAYFTEQAVQKGVVPKGYKLATTKTHRKLSDPPLAAQVLLDNNFKEDDIYEPRSLRSIAQLEKLGKKGYVASLLSTLIVRPEGSPKLVKDENTAQEDFK
jgi:hypothetical protein